MVTAQSSPSAADEFFALELADNSLNGIELNLIVMNDSTEPRYSIDQTEDGAPTMFGTLKRNLKAEEQAMQAGLAPGQVRAEARLHLEAGPEVDQVLLAIDALARLLVPRRDRCRRHRLDQT